MRKFLPHPWLSLLLAIAWLLMLNSLSAGGVAMAVLLGLAIPAFIAPFWPGRLKVRHGWPMVEYFLIVLWDITLANFHVARLVLFCRNRDLRPCWMAVPLDLETPEAISVLAATITLTPGTVSADLSTDRRYLLVHALDTGDPDAEIAQIKARYEERLKRIFQ